MDLKLKIAIIQKEIGVMKKDTKGYNYMYFDINQMLEQLQPLLQKHKILLTQPLRGNELHTILQDLETEDTIESNVLLPEGVEPQKMGAAITYYRRYSLQSLLALQAEDDDASSTKAIPKVHPKDEKNGDLPF